MLNCVTGPNSVARTVRSIVAPSPLCESNSQLRSVAWYLLRHLLSSNHCVDQVHIHSHSGRRDRMLAGLFPYSDQAQGKAAAALLSYVMFYLTQMPTTSAVSVVSISFFTLFL